MNIHGRLEAALRSLGGRRAAVWIIVAATLLSLASLGPRFVLDDDILALIARGSPDIAGLDQDRFDLFTFTTGDPRANLELMDQALMLPWWTDLKLKIAFYRPLSSATHRLDFALFPQSATLMHLHSALWYAVLLGVVAWLYRRLETEPRIAGLALLLYAIDDAHGPVLSWISNRNALIAAAFGVTSLVLHDLGRRGGSRLALSLAPLVLLAGLFAGEFALGIVAYLFAYAVFLDRGSVRNRIVSFLPYALAVGGWRVFYDARGFGAHGSGAYIDPAADPLAFLAALPAKLLVLLNGQLSAPPSDPAFIAPPTHLPLLVGIAVVTMAVMAWLLAPILRADRTARFWASSMVLSTLPLVASFPSDRLLLLVGLGAMGLFARLFSRALAEPARHRIRRGLVALFAVLHLVVAAVSFPLRARQMKFLAAALEPAEKSLFAEEKGGALPETMVLVNPPTVLFASYLVARRAVKGAARPAHLYWLAPASSDVTVSRVSEDALVIRPEAGFLYTPQERHYRARTDAMPAGHRVELSTMSAEIVETTDDGRPAAVRFRFPRGIGSGRYAFYEWRDGRYQPFELPPAGQVVELAEHDAVEIVARAAFDQLTGW